jgi:MFS family permease
VPDRWRGLMSGVVGGGGIGGMLAAFVFWITTSCMSNAEYEQWGWRILFFTSILSSFMGFMVARKLEESPVWTALAKVKKLRGGAPSPSPLSLLFSKQHFRSFLANLPLIIGAGAGYYLTSGYLPSYLKIALHLPNEKVSVILSVASIAALCASLFVGHMSQVFGRRSVFLGFGVFRLLALPACCLLMTKTDNLLLLCLLAALFGSGGNAAYAPLLVFLNERFPTTMRATGVGFSWSVGFAMGGMAPTFTVLAAHTPAQLPISHRVPGRNLHPLPHRRPARARDTRPYQP